MRRLLLFTLLSAAVLGQACSPDETGVLPSKKTTTDAGDLGGGVGNGPSPTPGVTPSPSPTPQAVLQALSIVPSTFTLSPDGNLDQQATTLVVVATMSDQRQVTTTATWTAAPSDRVVINAAGYVRVVPNAPAGSVTITASSGSITAQATAVISAKALAVSHVELSPTELTLYKPAANGSNLPEYPTKAPLYPTVVMSDLSTTSAVTWSVSDPAVATVSLTGLVSALGSGSCLIEARSTVDPAKKATCNLTVSAKGAVSVTLE